MVKKGLKRGGRRYKAKKKQPPKHFATRRHQKKMGKKDAHDLQDLILLSHTVANSTYCKYACCWRKLKNQWNK